MSLLKERARDFSVVGGRPAFSNLLHTNTPGAGSLDSFTAHIEGIWKRKWFTNSGPLSEQLEAELAAHLDVDHCVLMANGTIAMMLVIKALGLSGNVILPAFTFVSTAHALAWSGIEPRFCDVEKGKSNICSDHCRALVDEQTSAIVATHCWGHACNVSALQDIASEHQIALLFDAAHAFNCTHRGQKIGRFGDAEVFSFHATKFYHAVEGGAITTNDASLAQQLRQMRNFGFCAYDETDSIGLNGKLSEFHAAAGLTNLESLPRLADRCSDVMSIYRDRIENISGFDLIEPPEGEVNNNQYVVALVDEAALGLARDQCIELLHAEGVLARRYFYPGCHKLAPHSSSYGHLSLPNTDAIGQRILVLPAGAAIARSDVLLVCDLLSSISRHGAALAKLMGERKCQVRESIR